MRSGPRERSGEIERGGDDEVVLCALELEEEAVLLCMSALVSSKPERCARMQTGRSCRHACCTVVIACVHSQYGLSVGGPWNWEHVDELKFPQRTSSRRLQMPGDKGV